MNSREKYNKMLSLEPYKDRREIPVFPMMLTTCGPIAGKTQAELFQDVSVWLDAMEKTFAVIGTPDVAMPIYPEDVVFAMTLPARRPGKELDENALYQFVEKPYFEDPAEYKRIYEMGWNAWYYSYVASIQNPPMTLEQVGARYQQLGANVGRIYGHWCQMGIVPAFDATYYPIYDILSLIRSMADFTCDLFDDPGPIMDIVRKYQPQMDEENIQRLKAQGGNRIWNCAMRSASVFASPTMFDEYIWPYMKASILRFWEAGIYTVLHADSNWLPMLHHFTELPKGCCHIELDGATDIFAAYDILQGCQSIRGDVPSTMFAYQTPEEVAAYCEKLVNMGMKGGFMLSSGCEIPLNAKPENIKAMMDAVK